MNVLDYWPKLRTVDAAIPESAAYFLQQAVESSHAPVAQIIVSASAVDAMLREKSLKDGSLDARIKQAVATGLIAPSLGEWAHEVRLDANEQRHVDEAACRPTALDSKETLEFALALAEALFVLPARIDRERQHKKGVDPAPR
jgi:Domain of unknown function (DUF4145)